MEAKFICSYKQTRGVLKDFFKYTFYRSTGAKFLYAVLALGAVLVGFSWKTTGKPGDGIVLISGMLIIQYFLFIRTVSSTYDKSKKSDGTECSETVEFYEDKLIVKTDMGVYESYEYSKIKEFIDGKRLQLLKTDSGTFVVLNKAGFTLGTPDGLKDFAAGKGIKIR